MVANQVRGVPITHHAHRTVYGPSRITWKTELAITHHVSEFQVSKLTWQYINP